MNTISDRLTIDPSKFGSTEFIRYKHLPWRELTKIKKKGKKEHLPLRDLLLSIRPYRNLSPFQYSRGLILILLLLLTPESNDVPAAG